jgi:lipid II:glycine glycyltransferase (peptidoglycan interpeptide bridge formation enzyme)
VNIISHDPLECENWDELLRELAGNSFFHTSAWAAVLKKSYGYRPVYLAMWEQSAIKAVLPCMDISSILTGNRGVSLPFTDYCEPIAANAAQFQELFQAMIALGKKRNWKYLEFRGGEAFLQNREPSECYYGHILDLTTGLKKLSAGLRDSTRRNIKKAEKLNIETTISATPQSMAEFCRLNALTRREHGLPPQPRKFFDCVFEHIISRNRGFIVLASLDKSIIAANVYFHAGDKVIYKYGASDKAYQNLRANNLVMWEAVKWSCDNGFKSLCFGRTEPENEGLRQFKAGWGAREYLIKYYKYDMQQETFVKKAGDINPAFKKIFGKLPVPVLKMTGNLLYRHMG